MCSFASHFNLAVGSLRMDKKRLVEQAKLAEQAERYEDMAKVNLGAASFSRLQHGLGI